MGTQANEILPVIEAKTFQNFLNRIGRRSDRTKAIYKKGIELLAVFLQKSHPDNTIEVMAKVDPYDLLDAFTGWLTDEGYSPNTTIVCVSAAKKWLRYNNVKVYTEEMKEKVELPRAEEALDDAPTKQQIRKILNVVEFETQNKMLLISCSGLRPVDLWTLKWTDFKWDEHPVRLIVPPFGKTKRGWETFITSELAERLKVQERTDEKIFPKGRTDLRMSFRKAVDKFSELNVLAKEFKRKHKRYKLHLY